MRSWRSVTLTPTGRPAVILKVEIAFWPGVSRPSGRRSPSNRFCAAWIFFGILRPFAGADVQNDLVQPRNLQTVRVAETPSSSRELDDLVVPLLHARHVVRILRGLATAT